MPEEKENPKKEKKKKESLKKQAALEKKKSAKKESEEKAVKKKRMIKKRAQKKKPKKSSEAREAQKLAKLKPKKPQFRGRFGKNSIKRKNKPKWVKWRVPRGKDLDKTKQYGRTPKSGYRTPKKIRGIHPSGYREILVHNASQLAGIKVETTAVRVGARVGRRKKNEIVKKANELKIKVLN